MKLHLTGGDGFGWALDEDLRMFRAGVPRDIPIVPIEEADTVFSPWWEGLVQLGDKALIGKRVMCGLDNPLFHWLAQPRFQSTTRVVGLWIAHSSGAARQVGELGLDCAIVPYAVRTDVFCPAADKHDGLRLRRELGIPDGAYVIGNFQRDTEGADLVSPKLQKGPDVLAAILRRVHADVPALHVLLAGPRRHWIRRELEKHGVPYTLVGKPREGDDVRANMLSREHLASLYHALDAYLLTSRWEGGPYALLEAAACRCPVLSSHVGLAEDLLDPGAMFHDIAEGARKLIANAADRRLASLAELHYERVMARHTPDAIRDAVSAALADAEHTRPFAVEPERPIRLPAAARAGLIGRLERMTRRLMGARRPRTGLRVSIFREYVKPPYGGGNQFMLALRDAMRELGVDVRNNEVGEDIDGYIFDSTWFNLRLLDKLARQQSPMVVHRIDGPIHLYRGKDREIDDRIMEVNARFATTSVIQSEFTMRMLHKVGYHPVSPVIIRNAPNPSIFNRRDKIDFSSNRKIRLISTSWSDNSRKGGEVYEWLDRHLDFARYEYVFVGRVSKPLANIQVIPPVPSTQLASFLKASDIYITASRNDPCSNALVEALSCGLPAIFLRSGGHPELVSYGGLGFEDADQIPQLLSTIVDHYDGFQACIQVDPIQAVARRYLACIRSE